MARAHLILLSAAITAAIVLQSAYAGEDFSWIPMNKQPAKCSGSIAECLADGVDEFEMDSEVNRRMLATKEYISYGALQANSVPCSRAGLSYYNCQPGAEANPYTRSCTAATRCRS